MRINTLRVFLAIVATEDLKCRQFDIKNVFTKSNLRETIYFSLLKGVKVKRRHVLRVRRSLYRLK